MSKKTHIERMNKVVQHIENNLDAGVNIAALATIACYSEFHFHRVFRSYIGESVYAFRKRLLLEKAVHRLLYANDSITDIAFKSGYDNQSSFNKAFKNLYSYTPSQVRQQRVSIQPLKIELRQDMKLTAEIKTIDAINVISAREIGSYPEAAPKAWGRVMKFAYGNRLMDKDIRSIGISHDDPSVTAPEQIRYDACVDIDADLKNLDFKNNDNLEKKTIAAGKYAMFLHKGSYETFPQTYSYIFNEWLPESDYQVSGDKTCFEVYLNRDPRKTKPENLRTEIYIPLV
ncbi:MAG: AraC family transcriptional regulator [Gammaproteobacteria bacterium]|nr:MAG: AraC family transcriptional regulator [Gammaproteobacteria bacterium]